jgi:hypothetical protein
MWVSNEKHVKTGRSEGVRYECGNARSGMPAGKQIQSGIPNRVEHCNAGRHFYSLSFRSGKEIQQYCVMRCLWRIELCEPHSLIMSNIFFKLLFQPIQGRGLLFNSVIIFSQTVGLLGRVISSSKGRYLNTGQHKHIINAYTHQPSMPWVGIEPTIPASERAKTVHVVDRADTVNFVK